MIPIQRIAVIGAGTMGHGIAQVAAMAGCSVALCDTDPAQLEKALERIRHNLAGAVARDKLVSEEADAALDRLTTTLDSATALALIDLAIEAVPEHLPLKRRLLAEVDAATPTDAIIATNTSSLSLTELQMATTRPERVIGLHFFNPVHLMSLVEIVRGERTDDATVERSRQFVDQIGKRAVVVRDSPGFATSRLGIALGNEAMRMLEQGVASAEDIDTAMELGYRHPMGPLRLSDLVGLDVRLAITEHLFRELGTDTFRPPLILRRLVRAGKLGRKTGEGFYRYDS